MSWGKHQGTPPSGHAVLPHCLPAWSCSFPAKKIQKGRGPHGNETWLHVAGNSQTWMFQWANHRTKNELSWNFHCHVWIVMKHTDTSIIECFYIQNLTSSHIQIIQIYPDHTRPFQVGPWVVRDRLRCLGFRQRFGNHRVCALERRSENWHDLRTTFMASNVTVLWCIVCRTS